MYIGHIYQGIWLYCRSFFFLKILCILLNGMQYCRFPDHFSDISDMSREKMNHVRLQNKRRVYMLRTATLLPALASGLTR